MEVRPRSRERDGDLGRSATGRVSPVRAALRRDGLPGSILDPRRLGDQPPAADPLETAPKIGGWPAVARCRPAVGVVHGDSVRVTRRASLRGFGGPQQSDMLKTGPSVLLHRIARDGPISVTIGNASLGFLSDREVRHRLGNLTPVQVAAIMAELNAGTGEHRLNLTGDGPIDRIVEYWRGHPTPDDV